MSWWHKIIKHFIAPLDFNLKLNSIHFLFTKTLNKRKQWIPKMILKFYLGNNPL